MDPRDTRKLVEFSFDGCHLPKTWFVLNINCCFERLIEIDQPIKDICFTETIERVHHGRTTQ